MNLKAAAATSIRRTTAAGCVARFFERVMIFHAVVAASHVTGRLCRMIWNTMEYGQRHQRKGQQE